jgi:hypothetical protein
MGWIENITKNNLFHVKFDISDIAQEKVSAKQMYNHFPDNRELTTKAGLCKNLWYNCSYESQLNVSEFFPRCYDISDAKQADAFRDDFN